MRNENIYPHTDLYKNIPSNLIFNRKNLETIQTSINRKMSKLWYIFIMKYFSVIKWKNPWLSATTQMNLMEAIMMKGNQVFLNHIELFLKIRKVHYTLLWWQVNNDCLWMGRNYLERDVRELTELWGILQLTYVL